MIDLSNLDDIRKIDPQNTLASTEQMPQQFASAWEEVNKIEVSKNYREINKIVFCGMGASIYGALVFKALDGREMPFPSEVVSDYFLPDWVDQNTLVVLTSYSGTTEEVLSCAEDAKSKNAKISVYPSPIFEKWTKIFVQN